VLGTAIQVIRQASGELGLPIPKEAAASLNEQVVQMLALLNSAGNELCRMFEWQFLRKTADLILVPGQSKYALPPDFSKLLNQTLWEKSNVYSVIGPVSNRAWAYLTNSVTIAPQYCFIIKDRQFQFVPTPGDDGQGTGGINYDYISEGWVQAQNDPSIYRSVILDDGDTIQFDFWLIVKFLKLKVWEAKGLDTTNYKTDFLRVFGDVTSQDKGASVLGISRPTVYLPSPVAPDTGFGFPRV
jgi:hypothetical protein